MTDNSQITKDIEALAWALGVDPENIKPQNPEWLGLMRRGVIVQVHLSRWRASTRLTADHLGLTFQDDAEREALTKTMKLGEVYLLPDRIIKALQSIDSGLRKSVSKYSYKTYWGEFLTPESYFSWKSESDTFKARYFGVRDEIAANWESILFEVSDLHMANARAAYRREKAHSDATGRPSQVIRQYSESAFVARYVDAILEAIPSRSQVVDSFGVDIDLNYIPLPSLIAEEQAQAEVTFAWAQAEKEKARLDVELKREVTGAYKSRLDSLVVDHLTRMVAQLNDILYQAAEDVLQTTSSHGRLHPRSVVQLRAAIDRIRAMNVLDYGDIEAMVTQAESLLEVAPEGRETAQVLGKLQDIATVTRSTLIGLGEGPERGKRAEGAPVAESAAFSELRQARGRLGLSVDIQPLGAARQARVDG